MNTTNITNEMIAEWKKEYESGDSLRKIGKNHGFSKATIGKHLEGKVTFREKSPNKKHANTWFELYQSGWSKTEIAKKYNVSLSTVSKILYAEKGVEKQNSNKQFEHLLPIFIRMYQEKKTLTEISNETGVSRQCILDYLKDAGIESRSYSESARIYELDETFFESIDSDYKAYILGLVFSSGSLIEHYRSCSLSIIVKKDRVFIMEEIFQALTDKKAEEFVYSPSDNCYKDRIFSRKIYDSLQTLGLSSRDETTFPSIESKYIKPFLKGYLKGSSRNNSKKNDLIINSESMMYETVKQQIISTLDIDVSHFFYQKKAPHSLIIYRNKTVDKIKEFIS